MAALDCVEPSCHVDVARVCFFSIIPRPPRSTLFPYTTPSRSGEGRHRLAAAVGALGGGHDKAARGIDRRVADRGRAGGGRGRRRLVADGDRDRVRVRARVIRRALLGEGGRAPWRGRGWSPGGSGSFKKK